MEFETRQVAVGLDGMLCGKRPCVCCVCGYLCDGWNGMVHALRWHLVEKGNNNCQQLCFSVLPHFKVNATCDTRHRTLDTPTTRQFVYRNCQTDVQLMKSLNHRHYGSLTSRGVCNGQKGRMSNLLPQFNQISAVSVCIRVTLMEVSHVTVKV